MGGVESFLKYLPSSWVSHAQQVPMKLVYCSHHGLQLGPHHTCPTQVLAHRTSHTPWSSTGCSPFSGLSWAPGPEGNVLAQQGWLTPTHSSIQSMQSGFREATTIPTFNKTTGVFPSAELSCRRATFLLSLPASHSPLPHASGLSSQQILRPSVRPSQATQEPPGQLSRLGSFLCLELRPFTHNASGQKSHPLCKSLAMREAGGGPSSSLFTSSLHS